MIIDEIDKAGPALLIGVICWAIYFVAEISGLHGEELKSALNIAKTYAYDQD